MNRASYKIATMCRVLGVSTSGYYGWRGREPSVRAQQDALLLARIRAIHKRSRSTYGVPRVHAQLSAQGTHVGGKRIARLMHKAGLQGVSVARNTGRRSVMKRFGQLLIWWNETSRPRPESTVGSGHYLHPDRLRIPLSGRGARCLQPPGGGLGYEYSPEDSAGARCAGDGFVAETSTERDPSF